MNINFLSAYVYTFLISLRTNLKNNNNDNNNNEEHF